jgi:hypothetical protein
MWRGTSSWQQTVQPVKLTVLENQQGAWRFAGFRTPTTAPKRWATGSGWIIIRASHGVTIVRQIDASDTSGEVKSTFGAMT